MMKMKLEARAAQAPVSEIPPELVSARPRPVRLTGTGRLVAGIGVLLPVAALMSGFWLHDQAVRDRALREAVDEQGIVAQAVVTELTRTLGKQSRYFVRYRYFAGERFYMRRASVGRAYWTGLRQDSRLLVRYLPSRPEQSWISGYEPRGVPFWAGPVVAVGLALLACVPWYALRRQRMLLTEGNGALAQVTRSKKVRSQHGTHYVVYYEFRLMSGAASSGRYTSTKSPPPDGTTICVVYDPDRPNRSARYPLTLVRLV
jgi:hypothetical protein